MSVTVSARFESVEFAERAARRVRSRFPQSGRAVIRCRQMADSEGVHQVPVSVLNSFSTNFQAVAYTSTPMFSGKEPLLFPNEIETERTAALEVSAGSADAGQVAGLLFSCGGYDVRTV